MQVKNHSNEFNNMFKKNKRDYSKKVFEREKKLGTIKTLLEDGTSPEVAFETVEISERTYFRWKKRVEKNTKKSKNNCISLIIYKVIKRLNFDVIYY